MAPAIEKAVLVRVAALNEKPLPVADALLIVTGTVPAEVTRNDFVVGVFTTTFPKARSGAKLKIGEFAATNCKPKVLEMPAALAVRVAGRAVPVAETVAVNVPVELLANTVTVGGTETAASLLDKFTGNPE